MTIDEAIKIKEIYHSMIQRLGVPGLYEADNLSIEALKCIKRMRSMYKSGFSILLPGETEE